MKHSLLLIALTVSVSSLALAAVGDMVSGNGSYVADGIVVSSIGIGYLIRLTVPEPSGTALSRLALVGLATHRRRKH